MLGSRYRVTPFLVLIAACPSCGCRQRVRAAQLFRSHYGCAACRVSFALERSRLRLLMQSVDNARRGWRARRGS